jgi:hypothetical protein
MVGVGGFEPPTSPIAIGALCLSEMVGVGGFEPPTSRSRTVRSSLTELHPDGVIPFYSMGLSALRAEK